MTLRSGKGGLFAAAAIVGALAWIAAPPAARASIDVSLNTAPYVFASYDASGNPIAGDVESGSGDYVSNNDTPFWTATYTFDLTSTADTLAIADLAADDRVEVELNGDPIAASGIYGPGTGVFMFTPTGSQVSETFLGNNVLSASDPLDVTGPFNIGDNTIELIINNTGNGISGGLTGGPSSANFTAEVITPAAGGVPEPASWLLITTGVLAIGAGLRVRRREAALAV
jgi:hypothetical protein